MYLRIVYGNFLKPTKVSCARHILSWT